MQVQGWVQVQAGVAFAYGVFGGRVGISEICSRIHHRVLRKLNRPLGQFNMSKRWILA